MRYLFRLLGVEPHEGFLAFVGDPAIFDEVHPQRVEADLKKKTTKVRLLTASSG